MASRSVGLLKVVGHLQFDVSKPQDALKDPSSLFPFLPGVLNWDLSWKAFFTSSFLL